MVTHLKPNIEIWQFLLIFPHFWQLIPLKLFHFHIFKFLISFFGETSPVKEGFTAIPTLGNCYHYYYYFQFYDVAKFVEIIHKLL